jgi:transposase InsO family protein
VGKAPGQSRSRAPCPIHCAGALIGEAHARATTVRQEQSAVNGLYKAEVIQRRGPWRSFEAVEFATLEWVDWFNNRRLLEPIGNIPPAEAEELFYAKVKEMPLAA